MHKTHPPAPAPSSTSKYSIGVVARLVQLPIETVRMWERRYDILLPARTEGGHRLYSDDDVLLLRAAKSLVDAGQRPGDVFRQGRARLLADAASAQPAEPKNDWGDGVDAVIGAARALDQTRVAALLDGPLVSRAPLLTSSRGCGCRPSRASGRSGSRARCQSPSSTFCSSS